MRLQNILNKLSNSFEPKRYKKYRVYNRGKINNNVYDLVNELKAFIYEQPKTK